MTRTDVDDHSWADEVGQAPRSLRSRRPANEPGIRPRTPADAPINLAQSFALACRMAGPFEVRAVHRESGDERVFHLTQPFALIGRGPGAGVRLNDPSVSQCHAYLQVVEGTPYCVDLGSRAGVIWDDGGQGRGWVTPGQRLRIGQFDVRVGDSTTHDPPDADPTESPEDVVPPALYPALLEAYHPAGLPGGTYSLDQAITLIGRHPACQLRFLDDSVRYFHCFLVNTPVGVWCLDLFGHKGTPLNGRPTRLARLCDGDLLEVGQVSLLFRPNPPAGRLLPARSGPAVEPLAGIAGPQADPSTGPVVCVQEMMTQFQQCFTTMARMFTAIQQEHAAVVSEQLRQLQELTRELRDLRGEGAAPPGGPGALPPVTPPANGAATGPTRTSAEPKLPVQSAADGSGNQTLADAHAWFLNQLVRLGQQPPP